MPACHYVPALLHHVNQNDVVTSHNWHFLLFRSNMMEYTLRFLGLTFRDPVKNGLANLLPIYVDTPIMVKYNFTVSRKVFVPHALSHEEMQVR